MTHSYEVSIKLYKSGMKNFFSNDADQAINEAVAKCKAKNKWITSIDYEILSERTCNLYITSEIELTDCRFLKSFSQHLVREYQFECAAKGLLNCQLVEVVEPEHITSSMSEALSSEDIILLKINRLWFSPLPDDVRLKQRIIDLVEGITEETPF